MAENPSKPRPVDKVLRYGAGSLVFAVAIVLFLELIARKTLVVPPTPYQAHAFLKIVRTPNYSQMKVSLEEPPYLFEFKANPLGFRGKRMQTVAKPKGTYRIFFVGASTTENQHLPEEKTFAGIVDDELNARFQGAPNVEVGNTGIMGFGIARSLSLIAHRLIWLEPDLIVVLDGENDLMTSLDDRWDPTNAVLDADETTFKEWLCKRSTLVAFLDNKTSGKEADTRKLFAKRRAIARAKPYHVPENVDLLRGLPIYRSYLRWVAQICKDAKVPLAFMTQPTLWKPENSQQEKDAMWMSCLPVGKGHIDPATSARLMDSYNQAIREVCDQYALPCVDLAKVVPKELEFFCDDAHLSAAGNKKVAEAVLETLFKDGKRP